MRVHITDTVDWYSFDKSCAQVCKEYVSVDGCVSITALNPAPACTNSGGSNTNCCEVFYSSRRIYTNEKLLGVIIIKDMVDLVQRCIFLLQNRSCKVYIWPFSSYAVNKYSYPPHLLSI